MAIGRLVTNSRLIKTKIWTITMGKLLIVILVLSLLFAAFFAVAGAGIYGSPFAPVPSDFPAPTRRRMTWSGC